MLSVTVKTKPITKYFKFVRVLFFYVNGHNFKISAYVKNHDLTQQFQGGKLVLYVTYAFGTLMEKIEGKIGLIEPTKGVKVDFEGADVWGVLANGHALFWQTSRITLEIRFLFVLVSKNP